MDSLKQSSIHQFLGQWLEQMLVLLVRKLAEDVDVPDEHNRRFAFHLEAAEAEIAVLHVILEDGDGSRGISEFRVGDLVEDECVELGDKSRLAGPTVDKKRRRRGPPAGEHVRVVGEVLVTVAL